jgi:hypothetical protein
MEFDRLPVWAGIREGEMKQTYVTLNTDGSKIPQFGLDVFQTPGDEGTRKACLEAFRLGDGCKICSREEY